MSFVVSYFAIAAVVALYSVLNGSFWLDEFPEDLYLLTGFCLLWPVSLLVEFAYELRYEKDSPP